MNNRALHDHDYCKPLKVTSAPTYYGPCAFCLQKSIKLIVLANCSHLGALSRFLSSYRHLYICLLCHNLLRKFDLFQQQVMRNVCHLTSQAFSLRKYRLVCNLRKSRGPSVVCYDESLDKTKSEDCWSTDTASEDEERIGFQSPSNYLYSDRFVKVNSSINVGTITKNLTITKDSPNKDPENEDSERKKTADNKLKNPIGTLDFVLLNKNGSTKVHNNVIDVGIKNDGQKNSKPSRMDEDTSVSGMSNGIETDFGVYEICANSSKTCNKKTGIKKTDAHNKKSDSKSRNKSVKNKLNKISKKKSNPKNVRNSRRNVALESCISVPESVFELKFNEIRNTVYKNTRSKTRHIQLNDMIDTSKKNNLDIKKTVEEGKVGLVTEDEARNASRKLFNPKRKISLEDKKQAHESREGQVQIEQQYDMSDIKIEIVNMAQNDSPNMEEAATHKTEEIQNEPQFDFDLSNVKTENGITYNDTNIKNEDIDEIENPVQIKEEVNDETQFVWSNIEIIDIRTVANETSFESDYTTENVMNIAQEKDIQHIDINMNNDTTQELEDEIESLEAEILAMARLRIESNFPHSNEDNTELSLANVKIINVKTESEDCNSDLDNCEMFSEESYNEIDIFENPLYDYEMSETSAESGVFMSVSATEFESKFCEIQDTKPLENCINGSAYFLIENHMPLLEIKSEKLLEILVEKEVSKSFSETTKIKEEVYKDQTAAPRTHRRRVKR